MSPIDRPIGAIEPPRAALPMRDRAVILMETLLTYGVVRWHLRREALPTVVTLMRRSRLRALRPRPVGHDAPRLAGVAVHVLERLPSDARCLTRSLVVLAMLERRGMDARLVLAARPTPTFTAHAWVERDGRPLLPTRGFADSRLTEL
jgi:hypothetical protein